ncbi:ATP-dependent sacrificial sulfur transferase LarE [Tichowtungia aerotolerans]|uniref:ATP-dependent sacrificial sulfur transferase LarE n=1 Tax=Tichowtungia aerotolerans TaxID=2697043 RepID=A0A6P1MH06_9BACT|nr:ATP-dependent sacrificial sulfur transferase LarE [Tichowtungia aerotolerans]QHI70365.1 ATP-dependent sacrificial sulfur transferase LarE [Tichowtungia aerotolerans]
MTAEKQKENQLLARLADCKQIAVAYSGGVDSTYLADVAHEALGDKAWIVIADSPSLPRRELKDATKLAGQRGWNLHIIQTQEHLNPSYLANKGDRCFHCKNELFNTMETIIRETGIKTLAYGAIEDDKGDFRPGAKAADAHQVIAPLQDVGLYKKEVRVLSKLRGLPTAEKASFACLGSRFPTGTPISLKKMSNVERAEEFLRSWGFSQYRVRHHGDLCRIELNPEEFEKILACRGQLLVKLQALGYRYITLDLAGYRTGSTS